MLIQKALENEGLALHGDSLPKDQRTQHVFKRLIAAFRAMEAEVESRLMTSQEEARRAEATINKLQSRLHELEQELLQYRLKDRCDEIGLAPDHRRRLLEAALHTEPAKRKEPAKLKSTVSDVAPPSNGSAADDCGDE